MYISITIVIKYVTVVKKVSDDLRFCIFNRKGEMKGSIGIYMHHRGVLPFVIGRVMVVFWTL